MQCLSVGSPWCPGPVSSSGFVSSEGRTSPLGLFILSEGAILVRDSNIWKMSSPSSHGPLTCLMSPDMTANNLSLLTPTQAQVFPPHHPSPLLVNTMQDVSSVRGLLTTSSTWGHEGKPSLYQTWTVVLIFTCLFFCWRHSTKVWKIRKHRATCQLGVIRKELPKIWHLGQDANPFIHTWSL